MTPEQMHRMTLFAVALNKMKQAQTAGSGVTLAADETDAMVDMIRVAFAKDKGTP